MEVTQDRMNRLRSAFRVLFLVGLAVAFLRPALGTGYWAEDVHHSVIVPGRQVLDGANLLDELIAHTKHTIVMGRFFPVTALLISSVHSLIRDVFAYKAFLIAMTAIDLLAFAGFVRAISGRAGFASIAACLTLGLFQFRVFVDPMLGYYGQMQLIAAALFCSLTALIRFLEGRGTGWLAASVACFGVCTLTYEATYPLVLLHFLLIGRARPKLRGLTVAFPFLGVVGLCAIATLYVRHRYPAEMYWHETDYEPGGVLLALAQQTTAAFPLSYLLADPLGLFPRTNVSALITWCFHGGALLTAGAALAFSFVAFRRSDQSPEISNGASWSFIGGLGLILAVLPGVMITISPYHRSYLAFGVGWVPVLIQSFGVGLSMATGLWLGLGLGRRGDPIGRARALLGSLIVASLVCVTYRANVEVALSFNAPPGSSRYREIAGRHGAAWHYHRMNLEAAFDQGLMEAVPELAIVRTTGDYPYWYDSTYGRFFFAKHTGKNFSTFPLSTGEVSRPAGVPVYLVKDALQGPRSGAVLLWELDHGDSEHERADNNSAIRVFVRHPQLFSEKGMLTLPFLVFGESEESPGPRILRRGDELTIIRSGRDWAIFETRAALGEGGVTSWRIMFDGSDRDSILAERSIHDRALAH